MGNAKPKRDLSLKGHSRIPNALSGRFLPPGSDASRDFIEGITKPRPGTMGPGEQAACLWWASLSPHERERMHGLGETQERRRGGEVRQRGQLRRQTPEQRNSQKARISNAGDIDDLTDADLLWLLAVDLGKHGLTMSTPGNIVAHLRSRVND